MQVSDLERAQPLAAGLASVDWVRILGRYARQVNPLLRALLAPMQYYWVTAQAEYSTDVLFRRPQTLEEWMPRLLTSSTLYFEAHGGRYLDALAHVDDLTPAIGALDALTSRAATADGRTVRPFNPVAGQERTLFEVLMSGGYVLHGFTNRELREHLVRAGYSLAAETAKQSGQVTRLLRRLHIHQLIAKIPRSRRWRVSRNGRRARRQP